MKQCRRIGNRIMAVFLAVVIVCGVVLCDYETVRATSVPVPVSGYSGFDIIYSLLQSIGITTDFGRAQGASYEDMIDEYKEQFIALNPGVDWDNPDTSDVPINDLWDELEALPTKIKNGTIGISRELWEFLNVDLYEECVNAQLVAECAPVAADYPYRYAFTYSYSRDGVGTSNIGIAVQDADIQFVTRVFDSTKVGCKDVEYYAISSHPFKYLERLPVYDFDLTGSCQTLYSYNYGYYVLDIYGHSAVDTYTALGTVIDCGLQDYLKDLPAVIPTPSDVIWPEQDLAYDVVNHVTTWDDAIASDLVIPGDAAAEEEDQAYVFPLVDTGVGEDVYVDAGATDIPIEDTNTGEIADELVDSSVIAALPDQIASAGDITEYFPFCIPFDIVRIIRGMKAESKPPNFHFKYHFKSINYTFEITVDLTEYEKYFKIFRSGIVIFWIITLMFITIRFSSGIVKE